MPGECHAGTFLVWRWITGARFINGLSGVIEKCLDFMDGVSKFSNHVVLLLFSQCFRIVKEGCDKVALMARVKLPNGHGRIGEGLFPGLWDGKDASSK